jgi:hypothetical protein
MIKIPDENRHKCVARPLVLLDFIVQFRAVLVNNFQIHPIFNGLEEHSVNAYINQIQIIY